MGEEEEVEALTVSGITGKCSVGLLHSCIVCGKTCIDFSLSLYFFMQEE